MAQTTASWESFREFIAEEMRIINFREIEIFNTICDVTLKREKIAEEMSRTCDIVLVVGGRHSSNTGKLFQIAASKGKALWIEKPEEVDQLPKVKCVGVVSGTSTPFQIVQDVIKKLEGLGGKEHE